ncbi:MAG TPA: hypothetical protein PLZ95_10390, partial [Bryobacteraceae bacterium]|nr:hypothetical protein [Bryobacteraceae bacterium]
MSVGQQERESLIRGAAGAAARATALLRGRRAKAEAAVSEPASEEWPAFLDSIEAPVEFITLPERRDQVHPLWRPIFLPLSILQAEGRAKTSTGARQQPWESSLSLVEKLKSKLGGGALALAKRTLMETGGRAAWWLPARLELLAAGEAAAEPVKQRWDLTKRIQADLSRQDQALTALAIDPDAPPAFEPGDAARLTDDQGTEGSWALDGFSGPVISTAFALDALRRQGVDEREAVVLRGGEWLRSVQNADGGWGAGGEARSSIGRTACAVFGLVSGGDAGSESVRRGLDYLLAAQDAD